METTGKFTRVLKHHNNRRSYIFSSPSEAQKFAELFGGVYGHAINYTFRVVL